MVNVTLALAEFDRWLKANDFSDEDEEERHFYDWLPLWYVDPADRAAIIAAWDARAVERARQRQERDSAEAAAERVRAERRAARLKELADEIEAALADDRITIDRQGFLEWWRSLRDDERDAFDYPAQAIDHWFEIDRTKREAAEREATARRLKDEAALAARSQREQAEREQQERVRADLVERLKNAAWARGEDQASLRAVVAWRLVHMGAMTFRLKEGAARDAIRAADKALTAEIAASVEAIAAAKARNARDPLLRAARGEQNEPVPPKLDLQRLVDQEAVARWFAAHREDLESFEAGRWTQTHDFNDDDEPTWIHYQWLPVGGFGEIQRQAARWTAYWQIEREATAHPESGDALHELGLKVLAGERSDSIDVAAWAFVPEKPPSEYVGEQEEEDDEKPQDEIARVRRPPSPARQRSKLVKRIESAIRRGHVTKTAIYDAVGGKRETVVELLRELLASGEVSEPDDDHAGYWLDGE